MIKAVFFDMDGVLVDFCELHYLSLNRALKEVCGYEIPHDEHIAYYNGISTNAKLQMLENRGIITNEKDNLSIWNLKQNYTFDYARELKIDEGKIELCQKLKQSGYKLACVSNSIRESIELILKQIGIRDFFDYIFANEDFGVKIKPDPYPYTLAMQVTGFSKEEVLIVEDSPKGILSAQRSGGHVWEVKNQDEVIHKNIVTKLLELDPWLMNTCFGVNK